MKARSSPEIQQDAEREDAAIAEARELLARFDREEEAIREQGDGAEARAEASERADVALGVLNDAEAAVSTLTAKVAELRAERRQLETQVSEHSSRASRFAAQEAEIGRQVAELRAKAGASSPVDELREDVAMLEDQLETLEGDIVAAEETVAHSRTREKDTRDAAQAARLKAKSLETEVATLIKLLKPAEAGRFKPHRRPDLVVAPGFESALGAALGDDLDVTADQDAPIRWSLISVVAGDPALPEGRRAAFSFRARTAGAVTQACADRRCCIQGGWRRAQGPPESGAAACDERAISGAGMDLCRRRMRRARRLAVLQSATG